jgi:hypothetical protein
MTTLISNSPARWARGPLHAVPGSRVGPVAVRRVAMTIVVVVQVLVLLALTGMVESPDTSTAVAGPAPAVMPAPDWR